MTQSDSELEGVYRFLGNSRVTPSAILAPHVIATQQRAGEGTVVIAHDTTEFGFEGLALREGLGRVGTDNVRQGFFGHFAVAVTADEARAVLGVVGFKAFIRHWKRRHRSKTERDDDGDSSESQKWVELATEVQEVFPRAIHVMDREADSYSVFARLARADMRFVIRFCRDKRLNDSGDKLVQTSELQKRVRLVRCVPLAARPTHRSKTKRKQHPPRSERTATLEISTVRVTIPRPNRPRYAEGYPPDVRMNVVTVQERDAPLGEEPVCWRLLTTEPIDTSEQVAAIVDAYRARWRIEEFFKALKTGCAFEKRQLESLRTLLNALAVFSVVAWRLLLLRSLAHAVPDAPANAVLTREQVDLLQRLSRISRPGVPKVDMPRGATANHALLAVARLGGHIKNNGPPGWIVLGRGYDKLLLLMMGYRAARAEQ